MQFLSKNNSLPLFLLLSFSGCCLDALCSTVTELTSVVMHLFLYIGLSLVPGCAFFIIRLFMLLFSTAFCFLSEQKGKKGIRKLCCQLVKNYSIMSGKVGKGAKDLLLQMHGREDLPLATIIQVKNHSRFWHLWKCYKLWNKLKAC